MQHIQITKNEAGQRLDKLIHKLLPDAGNGFIYKMLRKKNISLNDKKADGKEVLSVGDSVKIYLSDETYQKFGGKLITEHISIDVKPYLDAYDALRHIKIVYENEHMLIINKPSGVLSQKAAPKDMSANEWFVGYLLATGQITKNTLISYKPSICNRLDRNTSGLLICGKTLLGTQQLNEWIKNREIKKFYRLFVLGAMTKGDRIQGFLTKNEKTNTVTISQHETPGSSAISTVYKPLQICGNITYMEVELITGKTHQIRAHLASIKHPLIGDFKYGNPEYNAIFKRAYKVEDQLLHAYRLEFPTLEEDHVMYEVSGKIFYAEEPDVYQNILKTYRG